MQAIIITIGDELLIGQTIDTNSAWMGNELNKLGIWVNERIAISDSKQHIIETLDKNISRVDIILITGGLGPTKDDLTKHVLTGYFNGKLIINKDVLQHVTEIFSKRNLPMLDVNRQQALVPDNCKVLFNQLGTAPGMMWQINDKLVVSMPGVPFEMKHLMQTYVLPHLQSQSNSQVHHRTLITAGIGESFLAKKIEVFEDNLPQHIKLAYLPSIGMVKLRLTARGSKTNDIETSLNKYFEDLKTEVKEYLFADNDEPLEETIGKLLIKNNATLSVAESCTGGFIASKIVSVAGSSKYFEGGVVSYSYQAKQNLLSVKQETLDKHGAVSEECVTEMVKGTIQKFGTTYAIAVSGIAGPDGGTSDKPVGTVWIALATKNNVIARKFNFSKDRFRNIELTYVFALKMLMDEITKSSRV